MAKYVPPNVSKSDLWNGIGSTKNEPTPTRAPKYTPAHVPTSGDGERKTERLQLVVKPSTKSRLAKYARDRGTSSNEVVQRLLDAMLDEAGY